MDIPAWFHSIHQTVQACLAFSIYHRHSRPQSGSASASIPFCLEIIHIHDLCICLDSLQAEASNGLSHPDFQTFPVRRNTSILWFMQAYAPCSTGSRHIFLLVRLLRPIKQAPWQPPQFLFINALNMVRVHIFPCLNYNIWCVYTATDREGDGNRCGIKMRMLYFCKLKITENEKYTL